MGVELGLMQCPPCRGQSSSNFLPIVSPLLTPRSFRQTAADRRHDSGILACCALVRPRPRNWPEDALGGRLRRGLSLHTEKLHAPKKEGPALADEAGRDPEQGRGV